MLRFKKKPNTDFREVGGKILARQLRKENKLTTQIIGWWDFNEYEKNKKLTNNTEIPFKDSAKDALDSFKEYYVNKMPSIQRFIKNPTNLLGCKLGFNPDLLLLNSKEKPTLIIYIINNSKFTELQKKTFNLWNREKSINLRFFRIYGLETTPTTDSENIITLTNGNKFEVTFEEIKEIKNINNERTRTRHYDHKDYFPEQLYYDEIISYNKAVKDDIINIPPEGINSSGWHTYNY